MKLPKQLTDLAASLGADIEVIPDSETSYTIEATAPDGMVWSESGGVSLVARIFTNWPETKAEAIADISERMQLGLEPDAIQ